MTYEYKAVRIPDAMERVQAFLDEESKDGWRLVQTFISMGYTVGLIFERERAATRATPPIDSWPER